MIKEFTIRTSGRSDFIDVTSKVREVIIDAGFFDGVCQVYIPHTTAGVTINENADPDVTRDIMKTLDTTIPWNNSYHHAEGNSAAHIKASLMGFSAMVPVESGRLVLGTWQCIYFCEFDGPRTRRVIVNLIGR
jgi:secondary thiamine-phosphate synthase enzyme